MLAVGAATICGTKGVIEVPFPFWCPTSLTVTTMTGAASQTFSGEGRRPAKANPHLRLRRSDVRFALSPLQAVAPPSHTYIGPLCSLPLPPSRHRLLPSQFGLSLPNMGLPQVAATSRCQLSKDRSTTSTHKAIEFRHHLITTRRPLSYRLPSI